MRLTSSGDTWAPAMSVAAVALLPSSGALPTKSTAIQQIPAAQSNAIQRLRKIQEWRKKGNTGAGYTAPG